MRLPLEQKQEPGCWAFTLLSGRVSGDPRSQQILIGQFFCFVIVCSSRSQVARLLLSYQVECRVTQQKSQQILIVQVFCFKSPSSKLSYFHEVCLCIFSQQQSKSSECFIFASYYIRFPSLVHPLSRHLQLKNYRRLLNNHVLNRLTTCLQTYIC